MSEPKAPRETAKLDLVMGIDPGFTGAIAVLHLPTKSLVGVHDMPLQQSRHGKNEINLKELSNLIYFFSHRLRFCVIEEVASRPGEGVSSVFRFGYGAGVLAGIIAANDVPLFYVKPSVWKLLMGVTSDKASSLKKASELFPDQAFLWKRKKDHGRAEAVLLAHLGQERFS